MIGFLNRLERPLWVYPILGAFLILVALILWQVTFPIVEMMTRDLERDFAR